MPHVHKINLNSLKEITVDYRTKWWYSCKVFLDKSTCYAVIVSLEMVRNVAKVRSRDQPFGRTKSANEIRKSYDLQVTVISIKFYDDAAKYIITVYRGPTIRRQ